MEGSLFEFYNNNNNKIRRKCEGAKKKYLDNQCREIEVLQAQNRYDKVYEKVKEISGKNKRTNANNELKDKDGNTIKNEQEILKRWKEYVGDLYNKDGKPKNRSVEETSKNDDEEGPSILRKEVEWAIKALKAKKATGIDEVPAEVLKIMEENGINSVWKLCQRIYETGIWPEDFTTAVMITLPKKPNANECKFFRTISLISHTSKILLKILHARMQKKIDENLSNTQFGYRSERGTRDAIGAMRQLTERRLEIGRDTYICFIDFEKDLDC